MRAMVSGALVALLVVAPAWVLAQMGGGVGIHGVGAGSVGSAQITDESVTSTDILNGTIASADLADGDVQQIDIDTGAIDCTRADYALTLSATTLTASQCWPGDTGLICEGTADDTVQGLLTWPTITTSDKTITLPDITGTVVTTGDTSSVSGTMITNDTVVLTTDTAGNYCASITTSAVTGLTGGASAAEGTAHTLALDYTATLGGNPALAASACVHATTGLICEGSTADDIEGLLTLADPTSADKTWTLPDETGTILTSGTAASTWSGTLTANGTLDANGVVTLGDGGDAITYDSSVLDISSLGAITGLLSGTGADNQATLPFDIGVTGSDAGAHAITLGIDGNVALTVSATGDGAGGVGARTVLFGATGNFGTNIATNIGNAGTDFIATTGGLTMAGELTVNDEVSIDGETTDAITLAVQCAPSASTLCFNVEDSAGNDILTVNGADGTTNIAAGAFTSAVNMTLSGTAHLRHTGTAPTLSSCGTTPSITGTDLGGKVTIGTGATTSCTVTFAAAFAAAPACVVTGDVPANQPGGTTSTSALTITSVLDMASDVIMYVCI